MAPATVRRRLDLGGESQDVGRFLCPPPRSSLISSARREEAAAFRDTAAVTSFKGGGRCRQGLAAGGAGGAACYRVPHIVSFACAQPCGARSDPPWRFWQPFVRSKRLCSKQNQSPPAPTSASRILWVPRSVPASLFKSELKRRADLYSAFTFRKKILLQRNLVNSG